jgi:glycosyltransferase involved in cell wall biosynthesis
MMLVRVLVCDLNIQKAGHWLSYHQYIIDNFEKIEQEFPAIHISFLYNQDALGLLHIKEKFKSRLHFLTHSSSDNRSVKKRFEIFENIKKFALANKINHLIMDFDEFQLPIFISTFDFKMSGILYRPHHRITPPNNNIITIFFNSFKRYKKKLAETLLLQKRNVKNIFILNDSYGVEKLNEFHKSNVFKFIPEPVFTYTISTSPPLDIVREGHQPFRYLIFGSMDERKNITNILKAYNQVRLSIDTEILIAGPATQEYLDYIDNLISTLTSIDKSHKRVLIKPGFFSGEEMDYFFSISNICLLIYQNSYGSSALIGRAAFHKRKVVGPNVGLMSEIIQQYGIGITCDPNSITQIAKSLKSVQDLRVSDDSFDEFYNTNSPEVYLKTLLKV